MDSTDMIVYDENNNNNDNQIEIDERNDIVATVVTTKTQRVEYYQTNPTTGTQELQQVTEFSEIDKMINYVSLQFNQNDQDIQNLENELNEKEAELSYGQNEYKKQTKLLISLKEKLSYRFNMYDEIKKLHEKFKYFDLNPVTSQHDYFTASVQQSKLYTYLYISIHVYLRVHMGVLYVDVYSIYTHIYYTITKLYMYTYG